MKSGFEDKERKKQERRHRLLRIFYTEDGTNKIEEKLELESKIENISEKNLNKILVIITIIIIIAITVIANICYYKKLFKKDKESEVVNQVEEPFEEGDLEIHSEELKSYMIDKLNGIYLKMAPTKLGDKVAYSLTYNYDILPTGYLHYKQFFTSEYITTVLVNGYPYVNTQELGLESDEEAYIATQLAVYEIVSRLEDSSIANGKFSLNKIVSTDEVYSQMVERVKEKAKEMADNAVKNTYENLYYAGLEYGDDMNSKYDEETKTEVIGPLYTYSDFTKEALRVVDKDYIPMTYFTLNNFNLENTDITILNKDMQETESVPTGEEFYIKIVGENKYCVNIKMSKRTQFLTSKIYYNNTSQKKYVVLDTSESNYTSISTLYNNIDVGTLHINFLNSENERLYGTKYYILNEEKEVIWDITGFDLTNITLPIGKYYIREYEAPNNYFLNLNEYEINITKNEEEVTLNVLHDKLF